MMKVFWNQKKSCENTARWSGDLLKIIRLHLLYTTAVSNASRVGVKLSKQDGNKPLVFFQQKRHKIANVLNFTIKLKYEGCTFERQPYTNVRTHGSKYPHLCRACLVTLPFFLIVAVGSMKNENSAFQRNYWFTIAYLEYLVWN